MTIKQLYVNIDNRPGRLVEALDIISGAGVNMRALTIAEVTDYGILRVLADKPEEARKALTEKGYTAGIVRVFMAEMGDRPGSTHEVLRVLYDADINVEYTYAFVAPGGVNRAFIVFRVKDNDAAKAVLRERGIQTVALEDVF